MKLVSSVVQSFKVAKTFRENTDRINSIDISLDGKSLISSSDDDSIVIYDCMKATHERTLHSKKYGVDLVRFTQAASSAIHCSTKVDDTIRYLSLNDNKYIRYFIGHTKKVISLSVSPTNNMFISGSIDKSVRIWDTRSPDCQGLLVQSGRPVANVDPEGMVFAIGVDGEAIKIYDIRSFDKGPFNTFEISKSDEYNWSGLKFSPDGKMIAISTNSSSIILVDSYQGVVLQELKGFRNSRGIPFEASFSPDSQFVFSGSTDGTVHVWNSENGTSTAELRSYGDIPIQCVQFNPKYMMLVSACGNVAQFWIPSIPEELIYD